MHNQQFYTRKEGFDVPLQAFVDAKFLFIAYFAICVVRTVNSNALDLSNIDKVLELERLPYGFWIAGDDGSHCSDCVVTPILRSIANRT